MSGLRDFLQGASNSAAGMVSAPVDVLAWALRKGGVPVPEPVGGSEWMARKGLTAVPQNRLAGALGEAVGGLLPLAAINQHPKKIAELLRALGAK